MKSIHHFMILTLIVTILLVSCVKEELPDVIKGNLSYEFSHSDIRGNCISIFFPTKTIGYASTESGVMYKTTDGGERWNKLNILSPVPLRTSYFLNKDIGYIFGGEAGCSPSPCEPYGSVTYKTTNGGKTWQKQNIPYKWSELNSAYFFSDNSGIAVGLGLCIKTSDGGRTWNQFSISDKNVVSKISFTNQNNGYALNLGGLFKTVDGGESWRDISPNDEKLTTNFYFFNNSLGYANISNKLYKTVDGGENWIMVDVVESSINYIYFVNEETGITLSKKSLSSYGDFSSPPWRHIVRVTIDGGQSWTTKQFEEEKLNERCLFAKDNIIYSLGYDKIFKLIIE